MVKQRKASGENVRQWQWRNAPADADIDREEGAFAEVAVSDFSMQSDSDIYPGGLRGFPQLGCCAGVFPDRFYNIWSVSPLYSC